MRLGWQVFRARGPRCGRTGDAVDISVVVVVAIVVVVTVGGRGRGDGGLVRVFILRHAHPLEIFRFEEGGSNLSDL